MRTDAEFAGAVAQDVAELLAAYDQALIAWEGWTPAATALRKVIAEAFLEARSVAGETGSRLAARAH